MSGQEGLTFVAVPVLQAPREGLHHVIVGMWFAVDARGYVAAVTRADGTWAPVANRNRVLAETLGKAALGDAYMEVVQLPVAFIPHRCDA